MKILSKRRLACLLGAITGIAFGSPVAEPTVSPPTLIPYPQKVEIQEGSLQISKRLALVYEENNVLLRELAETCVEDLEAAGYSVIRQNETSESAVSTIRILLDAGADLSDEGYRLKVDSAISITATTATGLFWGTRTLLQLLNTGSDGKLPRLIINDHPEFGYRGLLVDNARQFHSIDFHLKTIKRMASLKLNRYQIHFSDHESYTLPSASFPQLPTPNRHYSFEEIKKLVAAAKKYHVMIVPEIDVPGHSRALTRGIRELNCADIAAGRSSGKLCIGKEETYRTLEKILSETMAMIPGEYWHLGADEVHYTGTHCEACLGRMKKENLQNGSQLFNSFINRMHGIVRAKGRKMLVWEGFDPAETPVIDKQIIVCPFDIKHRGRMPGDYFKAGYTVLNTSWTPLYVADKIYMTTPEVLAMWSPYMFGAGRSPHPYAYWKKFRPEDYKSKIMGAQMCSWAMPEKVEEGLLFGTGPGFPDYGRPGPRAQIMAERVWTGSSTSRKDLLERAGVSYW